MTSLRLGVPQLPPYPTPIVVGTTIELWSGGAEFSPQLRLHEGQDTNVVWHWSDGTVTVNELAPVKDFGSAGVRRNIVTLSNAHALELLNLGYDAGDGGPGNIPLRAPQDVRSIVGLQSALAINYLAVSQNNGLLTLDCSDLPSLVDLEAYLTRNLGSVSIVGCSGLRRVCFEDNNIHPQLDLRSCSGLLDLRGAANGLTSILWPESGMPNLWHMCLQSNGALGSSSLPDLSLYPSLREFWLWNCGLTGTLTLYMVSGASIIVDNNELTGLDLTHVHPNGSEVRAQANPLESIVWGTSTWVSVRFDNCNLSSALVDAACIHLAGTGRPNGVASFVGCSAPTAASLAARNSLTANGWALSF